MGEIPIVKWNSEIDLAISDVDETIADVNVPAETAMMAELSSYLNDGGKLFLVSGGSLDRVTNGVTNLLSPKMRRGILVAACSGSEVWGFDEAGEVRSRPFYSVYDDTFTPEMKQSWRDITGQIVTEFGLRAHPMQPKSDFRQRVGDNPLDMMLDDRGPQITFTLANARDVPEKHHSAIEQVIPLTQGRYDLRVPIIERAKELFTAARLPVEPRLAGNYSIDFVIAGVSKKTAVQFVLSDSGVLASLNLDPDTVGDPAHTEVWGDKYSVVDGGTDRHISEALPTSVRSIDFRAENPAEFPEGYNIVLWDGKRQLHHGLLEYLQSRRA